MKKPDIKFGRNIRDRRMALGLTQADIGRMVNVDQGAVSKWEVGETKPVRKYRAPLAKALKCEVSDLFPEN